MVQRRRSGPHQPAGQSTFVEARLLGNAIYLGILMGIAIPTPQERASHVKSLEMQCRRRQDLALRRAAGYVCRDSSW